MEDLVPCGGGVHEEALDGLFGLLLCAPLDECLANWDEGGHEVREGVAERLVLADVGEDGEGEGGDGGVGVGDGEEADDLAEDVGVEEVPGEHRGQHQQQFEAALPGVDA